MLSLIHRDVAADRIAFHIHTKKQKGQGSLALPVLYYSIMQTVAKKIRRNY
jgi:hypothetical protein